MTDPYKSPMLRRARAWRWKQQDAAYRPNYGRRPLNELREVHNRHMAVRDNLQFLGLFALGIGLYILVSSF